MKITPVQNLLTRVEGHGSIELIRDGARIVDARLHIHESPRFFEKLLVGRSYEEVADIACRICSICSTAHKTAALTAMEAAFGVVVSPLTTAMRRLAMLGGIIESHALHLVCLVLPDYRNVGSVQECAGQSPVDIQHGLKIKSFGNLMQEIIGGRAIHPFNLIPGGLGKAPTLSQIHMLSEKLADLESSVIALTAICHSMASVIPEIQAIASAAIDHTGHSITTSAGETISENHVINWLAQKHVTYSNALQSCFGGGTVYQTGPLPRQKLSGNLDTTASISAAPQARMIELNLALEEIRSILAIFTNEKFHSEKPVLIKPEKSEGIAILEAPRGILVHRYRFDDKGVCSSATIVTPTAINQRAIQESLTLLIHELQNLPEVEVRHACEHLVRLFDPCMSCAVH